MTSDHDGDSTAKTAPRPPETAWALENAVFTAAMVAQRLPWTDAVARALGLEHLTREGVRRALLEHLRRTRSGRPVRLRTPFGNFLVPLTPEASESLLVRADEERALEPAVGLTDAGQRYGLSPHTALTWEGVAPGGELPTLVTQYADEAVEGRRGDGTLEWQAWGRTTAALARHLVAGGAAAEDTLLSEIVTRAATADGRGARADFEAALRRRTARYLEGPDPDSLVGRLVAAGASADTVSAAVAHALALVTGAATATTLQALALHTVEPAAAPRRPWPGRCATTRRWPPPCTGYARRSSGRASGSAPGPRSCARRAGSRAEGRRRAGRLAVRAVRGARRVRGDPARGAGRRGARPRDHRGRPALPGLAAADGRPAAGHPRSGLAARLAPGTRGRPG